MWVLEQIRVSVEQNHLVLPVTEYSFRLVDIMFGQRTAQEKRMKISRCPNIITPNTIPEFCIPPKITPPQELKSFDWSNNLPDVRGSMSENGSLDKEVTAREPFSPHIIQVENVDELLYDNGFSDEESTNADPQSQAALSLPHLPKAQTCYGFCTLLESPHTRRKESLFHSDPNAYGIPLVTHRSRATNTYCRPHHSASFSLNKLTSRARLSTPRVMALNRQSTRDSDTTTSSTESSPFNSPLLARTPPKSSLLRALGHEGLLSRTVRKAVLSRNNSLSTDEGSSTDNSPNTIRKASEGLVEPPPSTFSLAPPPVFPMDLVLYRERVMNESLVSVGREGVLRLSAEYCPDNQRLRVRLISAEGLYAMSVDAKSINCSVSICLLPGKIHKQRSTVIKRSRNPIFNEDFFFDGICEEDVENRSLRFKVVNKMSTMKRDYILGDCEILLNSLLTV